MAKHVVPVCVKTFFLMGYVLVLFTGQAPAAGAATGGAVVPPCRRQCGDVHVPYPFGLDGDDPSCYLNPVTFSLTCNASFHPPILVKNDTRITYISLHSAQLGLLLGMSYSCYNASGLIGDGWRAVYSAEFTVTLSYTENIYVAIGCDTQAYITGLTGKKYVGGFTVYNYTGGCTSSCHSLDQIQPGECSGIGCCQTSLPKGIRGYEARVDSVNNHTDVLNINPCSYSFVVEKRNWTFKVTDLTMPITRKFPVVLDWYVSNHSCEIAMEDRTSYACISNQSHCINSTNGAGYICKCSQGYHGNPYEQDGCQDINECGDPKSCHRQAVCVNTPGNYSCMCPVGTAGDPYTYGCVKMPHKQTRLRAILGVHRRSFSLAYNLLKPTKREVSLAPGKMVVCGLAQQKTKSSGRSPHGVKVCLWPGKKGV